MKVEYVIEDGIETPNRHAKGLMSVVRRLEIGQSVLCEKPGTAQTTAYAVARETGRNFITRSVDGGVRIWRLS